MTVKVLASKTFSPRLAALQSSAVGQVLGEERISLKGRQYPLVRVKWWGGTDGYKYGKRWSRERKTATGDGSRGKGGGEGREKS